MSSRQVLFEPEEAPECPKCGKLPWAAGGGRWLVNIVSEEVGNTIIRCDSCKAETHFRSWMENRFKDEIDV